MANNLSYAIDEATGCEFHFSVDPPKLSYSHNYPELYVEIKCRFSSCPIIDFKSDMAWWDPQDHFPIDNWLHDAGIPLAARIDAFRMVIEYESTTQVDLHGISIKYSIYYGIRDHDDEHEFERTVMEQQSLQQESSPTQEFDRMVTEFTRMLTEVQSLQEEEWPSPTLEFERNLAEFERIATEEYQPTQLEEPSTRAMPASREAVEALERVTIRGDERESSCVVCLEELLLGLEATKMPCTHLFHGECIGRWLEDRSFCPLCRFELPLEEEEPIFQEMEMPDFMLPPSHEILVESIYV